LATSAPESTGLLSPARGLGEVSPKLAGFQQVTAEAGSWLYLLLAVFLLAAIAALWRSVALYQAGDDCDRVARTDAADLEYLASGLDKLRTFFNIQVLVVLVTAVVALTTALVLVALTRHVP
jgi:hypothetical protein